MKISLVRINQEKFNYNLQSCAQNVEEKQEQILDKQFTESLKCLWHT